MEEQAKIVKSWIDGKASLVIATTALGHGVDRPDVRHVFHLGVPQSLEEWVQEAGRGGRDEKPAKGKTFCVRKLKRLREVRFAVTHS